MKTLRIYVDTSVLGGCFDPEFAPWSNGLMDDFHAGRFRPVLSDVVAGEIRRAPEPVRLRYADLLAVGAERLSVTDEALALFARYQERSVLPPRLYNDMLHVALATIAEVDVLVSWNFKHIVRLEKIRLFDAVNIEQGYKPLSIRSPREVTTYEADADEGR